jgi:uncharacterized protein (DUF697 family)
MDSNFQVTINANIQGLQKAIKDAQSTLNQFDKSVGGAANSTEKLNNNANRGRLAAFAFGQVIRDAGFFANDFGLGLLAISNNIPILIDQLVLLSNVSKGLGVALSLAGSIITAALTVVAYTMMYAKDATEEYNKELAKNTAAAQTQIVTLNSLLSIAKDETLSLGQRQDAVNRLNKEYDIFNGKLTINGAKSQATAALVDRLSKSLLLNAQASALANAYTEQATKLFTIQNTPLAKQATMLDKAAIYWGALLDAINPFTGQANPLEDFTKGATANLNKIGLKNFQTESKNAKEAMNGLSTQLKDVLTQLTALQTVSAKAASDGLGNIGKETLIVDSRLNKVTDTLNKYYDRLKDLELTAGITPLEIKKGSAEALGDLIINLQKIPDTQRTVALLKTEFNKLNGELEFAKNFGPIEFDIQSDPAIIALQKFSDAADSIFRNGILDTITSTMSAIGEAIAAGGNIGDSFGNALLGAIGGVIIEFGKLIIATAVAGEAFSLAMKQLFSPEQWAIALVAGSALIAAGSAIRGFSSKKTGGSSSNNNGGNGNMYGSFRPFAVGGIVSGPTNALIGEYPGARSNPEVVAPLDKLTGIIAGSIGGGDMGGTLSTRISGNDLVILLDRASKNRKNYF